MRSRPARHAMPEDQCGQGLPISGTEDAWFLEMSGNEYEVVMSHLSAHAEYRHEDYYFARTQSRALAARKWEHTKRVRSWSEIVVPALGAAAAILVVVEMVH
jgi:sarcosine oxidase delta subunit